MAEVQNNSQGFITGQPQTVGQQALCTSPRVTATTTAAAATTTGTSTNRDNSPPRGPRTLLLRRGENGFGFTLRHFIVYPPESCCMLPGHERTRIDEPMDTIFVKQVRQNSPASEAGLRMGDRVVSVDGKPTRGEQYASVVQRIQQADPWLRLLVVSKEDDILQRYFGETAHNPETNQRPRLRSPERATTTTTTVQRQRRSVSLVPGLSSTRNRQSWVCSSTLPASLPVNDLQQGLDCREARRDSNKGNGRRLQDASDENRRKQQPGCQTETKYDTYERTRPDSIYSRPSSEQIYDRIKDPIYERVRRADSPRINSEQQQQHHLAMLRYPVSQAEPQVPIYRPGRRVMSRRASEGSQTASSTIITGHHHQHHHPATSSLNDEDLMTGYGSLEDGLQSSDEPGSRLSIDSRRDSSPSAYDSTSTLTGNVNGNGRTGNVNRNNGNANDCLDDSVIMTRLRKSFEQKEEFLRRPSHPIGWFLPDGSSLDVDKVNNTTAVVRREFYARPQKLQRQIWPPGNGLEPTRNEMSPTRKDKGTGKPSNQSVQRVKSDSGETDHPNNSRFDHTVDNSDYQRPVHQVTNQPGRQYCQEDDRSSKTGGGKCFVGTLSKIQENISNTAAIPTHGEVRQGGQLVQESRNGSVSLPPSPGPEKRNVQLPVVPQGLQIVSKRAKQFESGRLMTDDEDGQPTGDRTNLYKSELSRLSSKRTVPNVAVRKREFESRAEAQEPRKQSGGTATKDSKSLDTEPSAILENGDVSRTRARTRSNSAESWDNGGSSSNRSRKSITRYPWQPRGEEFPDQKEVGDSLGPKKTTTGSLDSATIQFRGEERPELLEKSASQDGYPPTAANRADSNDSRCASVVFRRQKNLQLGDEDRATRRVSYLKATWGERMHVDSDLDLSDCESVNASRSDSTGNGADGTTGSIGSGIGIVGRDVDPVEREGPLHVKFTVLDGKRSTDRSWKQVWGVLRGPILTFYKDRHSQSPSLGIDGENTGQNVDVRCSSVDIAEDYTKRKHVLRLANPGAEVLLQTEDAASMALWLRALHEYAAAERPSDIGGCTSTSKQQAVPQTPGPTTANAVPTTTTTTTTTTLGSNTVQQRLSPIPGHKGIKKLTSFRNRSPTGQSPVNKTRKPSNQPPETLASPKTKTWKGRVAKQLRRMHGQAGSPSSPSGGQLPPEGATFKVPLELCPPSSFSEFVPLIVEMCTSIVEARGLEVVGIYRVPGNTAAISHLTDSVNRGFENINLQDPRWSDVNVISSLLKSFFRQLPDSLLTADLYPMFIDADKVEDPQRRMTTIRKLLRDLPEHHFETLKYLMFHLKKIVEHSEVNKMEAKNLAIVFGPTLVRASGSRDNMVTMVNDMSHQCRIVESLLNNVDWFFSDEDLDDLSRLSVNLSLPADGCEVETTSTTNHNLLLNNIQKVEGTREMASARDIVSSIISAANRKIQRRRKGQDETDNDNHEQDKNKQVKQELDSIASSRRSMALNERQCSVSEIVLMHETKSQGSLNNNNNNNSLAGSSQNNRGELNGDESAILNDSGGSSEVESTKDVSKKLPTPMERSTVSSCMSESSRLSSETGLSCFDANSTTESVASNETRQSNDEITIRTYAGLSATTQERIRKFEQETKAMLQRDQNRQRREAEKRDEERRRIEMEWQLAKREMENDDLLDSIVDDTVSPGFFANTRLLEATERSFLNLERHRNSRHATRRSSQANTIQPEEGNEGTRKTGNEEFSELAGASTGQLTGDNSTGNIKKLKTDNESTTDNPNLPAVVRYGSLDSLHESHDLSRSPSQQRKHLPGDISDDGSDLLTSLTTTFDRKWRSLVNNPSSQTRSSTESVVSLSGNEEDEEDVDVDVGTPSAAAERDRNERWCTVRWLSFHRHYPSRLESI